MNSSLLTFIVLFIASILAIDIMRRSIDVFLAEQKLNELKREMRKLTKSKQPQVSVLIWGSTDKMRETVRSVKKSNYFAYDIVTREERRGESELKAYRTAYRKSQRGSIIVCLRAGEVVDRFFLKRLVLKQEGRSRWRVEVEQPTTHEGLVGLVALLQAVLWGNAVTIEAYGAKTFRNAIQPAWRFKGKVIWAWTLILGFIAGGVVVFEWSALWYAWLLFVIYLLGTIWIQETPTMKQRLASSFAVPSALFFMPATSFIQGVLQLGTRK